MRNTVKIILIATVIAFAMQSTAMAKWQLKPPGEIAKNLGKRAAKNEKLQKAAKEKLKEEVDDNDDAAEKKTEEKESDENDN